MTRGLLERLLNPGPLDAWFERAAEKPYTRDLLFSTVVALLIPVVCGVRQSVHVAYPAVDPGIGVSVQSGYNKVNGLEPAIAVGLAQYAAEEASGLIQELGAERAELLPGYQVKIWGNHSDPHLALRVVIEVGAALAAIACPFQRLKSRPRPLLQKTCRCWDGRDMNGYDLGW